MFDRVDNDAAPAVHARSAATPGVVTQQPGTRRTSRLGLRSWAAAALVAMVLAACGGGGDGGVGTNGTGITMGTVNGFGSVIVDGLRFDDASAQVQVETAGEGDSFAAAEVKLGQRTRVQYSGSVDDLPTSKGVASRIEVDPSIVGVVTAKGASTLFTVLGQSVEINPTVGAVPVTVFDGYPNGFADIAVGDTVEVHAIRSGSGSTATFQATRVEKKSSAATSLRVSGLVGDLSTSAGTFRIGGLTVTYGSASVLPSQAIAPNMSVVVFAALDKLTGTTLRADKIRIRSTSVSSAVDDDYVGGLVAVYAAGSSMTVDGTPIDLTGSPEISGTVSNGVYVRVKGRFVTGGTFKATKVQVRNGNDDTGQSELHGTVLSYLPAGSATAGSLVVRDILVAIPAGFTNYVDCGAGNTSLANGAFVEVKGFVSTSGVTATEIQCEDEGGVTGAVVTRTGTVANFVPSSDSFDLQIIGSPTLPVRYSGNTVFIKDDDALSTAQGEDLLGSTLAVKVEGTLSGGFLIAHKIKPD